MSPSVTSKPEEHAVSTKNSVWHGSCAQFLMRILCFDVLNVCAADEMWVWQVECGCNCVCAPWVTGAASFHSQFSAGLSIVFVFDRFANDSVCNDEIL
jgi:hypothetical protein